MPTFLSDPSFNAYLPLAVAALVAVGVWFKSRGPRSRVAAGVTVGLLALLLSLDAIVESPREQAVRRVTAMEMAANARQWGDVGSHIATAFDYHGMAKPAFLATAEKAANQWGATVHFTDFDREYFAEVAAGKVRLGFVGQISSTGSRAIPVYVEAEFAEQPGGDWLMSTFKVYNYITRTKGGEERLPGL